MGLDGWNISKLTGHANPKIGGYAFDLSRNRLWIAERHYGVFRLDIRTNDFEYMRFPLDDPAYYGPVGVFRDGSVMVAAVNGDRIMRFDADVNPVGEIEVPSIIDLNVYRDAVGVLVCHDDGFCVECRNAEGLRLWRTHVADGPTCNYFDGYSSIFCTDDGIVVLVGQKHIERILINYSGEVVDRKVLGLECGSWRQDLMAQTMDDAVRPTGRRYVVDAAYNHRTKSLCLLYAPPAGNYGLMLIEWPIHEGDPTVFEVPEWSTRIISVAGRWLCYGSETFSGPKMMYIINPDDARRIPTDEVPMEMTAGLLPNPNLLQELFAEKAVDNCGQAA